MQYNSTNPVYSDWIFELGTKMLGLTELKIVLSTETEFHFVTKDCMESYD